MTEDPRDYGLTASDLRDAADRLYDPRDNRLCPIGWTHGSQVRYGQIRSRLRSLADAIAPDNDDDEDQADEEAFHCAECGGLVGMFIARPGWQHFRGTGTVADPVVLYDAGHEAAP